MVFKNKHVIVAMLVAPILAVLAWYAVDSIVAEEPFAVEPGKDYQLLERPNCRYESGKCGLSNGDMKLTLVAEASNAGMMQFRLSSLLPLEGVTIAMVAPDTGRQSEENSSPSYTEIAGPITMKPDQQNNAWMVELPRPEEGWRLRLVASANQAYFYGDASTQFIDYQHIAGKDFRREE